MLWVCCVIWALWAPLHWPCLPGWWTDIQVTPSSLSPSRLGSQLSLGGESDLFITSLHVVHKLVGVISYFALAKTRLLENYPQKASTCKPHHYSGILYPLPPPQHTPLSAKRTDWPFKSQQKRGNNRNNKLSDSPYSATQCSLCCFLQINSAHFSHINVIFEA